jgi:hypothetical protein
VTRYVARSGALLPFLPHCQLQARSKTVSRCVGASLALHVCVGLSSAYCLEQSLTVHSTLSYRTLIARYSPRTSENQGDSALEKLVRYRTGEPLVRVFWRTIARDPGTVSLWFGTPYRDVVGAVFLQTLSTWATPAGGLCCFGCWLWRGPSV